MGGVNRQPGAPLTAVIWRGIRGGSTYSQPLQRYLPAGTAWTLSNAVGMNLEGQVIGDGTLRGSYAAYLLTPSRLDCACY